MSGGSLELFSPAKVNLFLRIIRRRPDGFHDLASLFHTVAFGDKLVLEAQICLVAQWYPKALFFGGFWVPHSLSKSSQPQKGATKPLPTLSVH